VAGGARAGPLTVERDAERQHQIAVELLIMGAGDELFARFGHAALKVRHRGGGELVYNYGYARFDDPRLILAFLRGRSRFWVGAQRFGRAFRDYRDDDRSFYRQPLALRPAQHEELALLLEQAVRPENRYYRYHHFDDNCSTRLRDLLDRVTGGALRRQLAGRPTGLTLRELVREGFGGRLPIALAAELLIGRAVDTPIDEWRGAFLPRILSQAVMRVRLEGGRQLAGPPLALYERRAPSPLARDPRRAEKLLWAIAGGVALACAALWLLARRRSRLAGLPLALCALALGAAALPLWALAAATAGQLPELSVNENLLYLWPTDLALLVPAVRWLRGKLVAGRLLRGYALARLAVAAAAAGGQLAGLLWQRPLVWLALGLVFGASLALAARALPCPPAS
jgi:hypothetical protein